MLIKELPQFRMNQNKNVVKITKSFVDKALPHPEKDQIFYRDEVLKGFALRITSNGVKSFVVEKIIGNKVRRITLGKYSKPFLLRKHAKKHRYCSAKLPMVWIP